MEDKKQKELNKKFYSVLWRNLSVVLILVVISLVFWIFAFLNNIEEKVLFLLGSGVVVFLVMTILIIKNSMVVVRLLRKMENEKKQTEIIVSNLINGVIQYDANFKILLINPMAEEILGVKKDDILRKKITSDTLKEDPKYESLVKVLYPALAEDSNKILTKGNKQKILEMKISKPRETDIQITTIPLSNESGDAGGYLKIIRDVSREKAISKTKSEFISIAAHQLRTPLSAIKWIFKMLIDGDVGELSKDQKDFLQKGYDSNERIIQLVSDMLNVARIEEGRFGYEFYFVDMEGLIRKSIAGFELKAEEKKIEVTFIDLKEKINPIKIDPAKIELVLQNLIDNALKYTPNGGKIFIKLEKINDDFIEVSVRDTGVGVPEDQKNRLFSKFFRGSNVIKMETEGTGLGLFIVRNIIQRHGGKIWVETKDEEGTTFLFTLPIKESQIPEEENSKKDDINL